MLKLIHISFLLGYTIIQACQPFVEKYNFRQEGKASYYANVLSGNATASGEAYHPDSLTAAHRHLPLGTVILVVNPKNQRKILLRVNDRGPYHRNRILDVSRSAADSLGFLDDGVAHVQIKALLSHQLADSLNYQLNKDQ